MSKIAHQIDKEHTTAESAAQAAETKAIAKDQLWAGEGYTIYVFDDNSFIAQSGPTQIAVDADDRASVQAYAKWLGDDVALDQRRIDEMLEALED